MTAGKFVVFEGLDGAGTSTQVDLLAAYLRGKGIDVEVTREPTGGAIGQLIRRVLQKQVDLDAAALALLFAADRIDHLEGPDGIRAALAAGRWVLSDRYVLSSVAYQASEGIDPAWVVSINRRAIAPHLTVYIEATPAVCMERIAARGGRPERFETLERLRAVAAHFKAHLGDSRLTGSLLTVDGDPDIDAVRAQIAGGLERWLSGQPDRP